MAAVVALSDIEDEAVELLGPDQFALAQSPLRLHLKLPWKPALELRPIFKMLLTRWTGG